MAATVMHMAEGLWVQLRAVDWGVLSSYGGLLGMATVSIYAGAFGSLPRKREGKGEKKEEENEEVVDQLSAGDAWLFPIIGSAALLVLYGTVKYLGEVWINRVLGWYFAVAGVGSVWSSSEALARYLVGETQWKKFDEWKVSVKKGSREMVSLSVRTPSVVLMPLALVPSGLYVCGMKQSAVVTDVLALSFAHNALSLLKLDSFRTGAILLSGLFVYDVWWVFGTEVMVKVATTVDGPMKLLWAKSGGGYTMLGLGDVVIPGTFVARGLRYDAEKGLGGRPYFHGCLIGYVIGLGVTMGVMSVSGRAQPALLYLSPACMLGFVVVATLRGEVGEAWSSYGRD